MLEVAVIADDLTGAADTGIAFALAGVPTFVAFGERNPPAGSRVVAFDTDSRALAADAAAARASAAATRACERGVRTIYKKIDSTLRGNVGAEAAAILRANPEFGNPHVVRCGWCGEIRTLFRDEDEAPFQRTTHGWLCENCNVRAASQEVKF